MVQQLQNLISINKDRLKEHKAKEKLASSEYLDAYYSGLIDELENSIWDLEEILKEIQCR